MQFGRAVKVAPVPIGINSRIRSHLRNAQHQLGVNGKILYMKETYSFHINSNTQCQDDTC